MSSRNRPQAKQRAQRACATALSLALVAAPALADEQTVELRSSGSYQTQRLPEGTREVELLKQLDGSCRFGRSWGYDLSARDLWVDKGCAGRFRLSGEFSRDDEEHQGSNTGVAIAAVAAIAGLALLASRNKDRDDDRPSNDNSNGGGWNDGSGRQIRSGGGMCLDIKGQAREGAQAILYGCHNGANQRFSWGRSGEIRVAGLCLDVANGGSNNGAQVIAYRCNGQDNQRWQARGNQIRSRMNGKCLDVPDGRFRAGQNVQLWDCHGRDNQRWWW